jgi:hypothetical protein
MKPPTFLRRLLERWLPLLGSLSALGLACTDPSPPRLSPEQARGDFQPPVGGARVLFIGHSLVNFHMPALLESVARSLDVEHRHAAQIRDGASLQVHWREHDQAQGVDARQELPTGRWDVVVMTEAVDLDDMIRWMEPAEYGGRFHALARAANPDTRTFLYETWHDRERVRTGLLGCSPRGHWRGYLDDDLGKWERIVADIHTRHAGPPMRLIPGGQAMARLVDAIRGGHAPADLSEQDLFSDAIHLTPPGNYFMALVHFSAIYRRSPEGATREPTDADGRTVPIAPDVADFMQRTAWRAVSEYAWSGVTADP